MSRVNSSKDCAKKEYREAHKSILGYTFVHSFEETGKPGKQLLSYFETLECQLWLHLGYIKYVPL